MYICKLLYIHKRAAKQYLVFITSIDTPPRPAGSLPKPLVYL
jgi:hypothetical protein